MQNAALLMMDVQNGIVSRYAEDNWGVMDPFRKAVEGARSVGIPVIFVRVSFRDGYPEVSSQNKMFSAIAANQGGGFTDNSSATQIHELFQPRANEPIVTKRRVSAFSGSDLEVLLRAYGVHTLILAGIATSGVVLSTIREAADKDYDLFVLSDACLDGDPEVHRVLMEKVFPRQATVLSVDEWMKSIK